MDLTLKYNYFSLNTENLDFGSVLSFKTKNILILNIKLYIFDYVHILGKLSSSIAVVGCLGTIHDRATDSKSLQNRVSIIIHFRHKKKLIKENYLDIQLFDCNSLLLNFRCTVYKFMSPKLVGWIFNQLNECY